MFHLFRSPFRTRIRSTPGLLALLCCAALTTSGALAAPSTAHPRVKKEAAPSGLLITRTFAQLGAGQGPIRLTTPHSAYVLKIPLSPREMLSNAKLVLSTANSTALIKSRSELSVRLNGVIIAQFTLDPKDTIHSRVIDLPLELLKDGYNDVRFDVIQHYSYECEDPLSPELWTEINPLQSAVMLVFSGLKPNFHPHLSQLHIAFDPRAWLQRPLSVVVGTTDISQGELTAAALVVEGLALRKQYHPIALQVYGAYTAAAVRPENTQFPGLSSVVVQGHDVLLIGTRAELSRYLDPEIYKATAAGPFVGIYPSADGESMILLVTGQTDEDVVQAARALAQPDFAFQDAPTQIIDHRWPFKAAPVATPDERTAFSTFGFRSAEFRGLHPQSNVLQFRAPADFGAQKGDFATVRLHFSYGAGLRKGSSLLLSLNGQFATSVPLKNPSGEELQQYEVTLPAEYVHSGYNTISFQPAFAPNGGQCQNIRDDGFVLTVYEDSTLELPRPSVAPVAPDLARFSQSLWPMQATLRIYLTAHDPTTAAAALSFVELVAQQKRVPTEVAVSYAPFATDHMMVIGPVSSLADFVRKALPLQRYDWQAEGDEAGVLQAVQDKRVITALIARDPQVLDRAVLALGKGGLWNALAGEASVIDVTQQTVTTTPASHLVKFGMISNLTELVSFGSWKWLAALAIALAALFAMTFVAVLRRHAEARRKIHTDQSHD